MATYAFKEISPAIIVVIVMISILQGAAGQRAELMILPTSEVLLATEVTLYCRIKSMGSHEQIKLRFGGGKYRALLAHGFLVGYPKFRDSKQLPSGSCLHFTNPDVQFCAEQSLLSVRFNATTELAGEASCKVIGRNFEPAVEKELRITNIFVWISPQDSRAGRRVEVLCIFDIPPRQKSEAKMTGLEDWTKEPDRELPGARSYISLLKKVSRVVTEEDNGRKVTCSIGREKKTKTLNIQ